MTSTNKKAESKSNIPQVTVEHSDHKGAYFILTQAKAEYIASPITIKLGTAGKYDGKPTNLSEAIAEVYGGKIGASPLVIKAVAEYNGLKNPDLIMAGTELKIPEKSELIDLVIKSADRESGSTLDAAQHETIKDTMLARMNAHENQQETAMQ